MAKYNLAMGWQILYDHPIRFDIPNVVERIRLGQATSYGSLHPGIRRRFGWVEKNKHAKFLRDDLYALRCSVCGHEVEKLTLPLIGSAPLSVKRRCPSCRRPMVWKFWLGWEEGYPEEAHVGS